MKADEGLNKKMGEEIEVKKYNHLRKMTDRD